MYIHVAFAYGISYVYIDNRVHDNLVKFPELHPAYAMQGSDYNQLHSFHHDHWTISISNTFQLHVNTLQISCVCTLIKQIADLLR